MIPAWLEFVPFSEPIRYLAGRREIKKLQASGELFTVLTSRDLKAVPKNYVNYFSSLYQMFDPLNPHLYLTQEMHASASGISYHLWAPAELKDFTQKLTQAVDVAAELHKVTEDYLDGGKLKNRYKFGAELHLAEHFMFPLLRSSGDRFPIDAMTTVCAALSGLKDKDEITVQFLLRPVSAYTVKLARLKYENYERFGSRPARLDGGMRKVSAWTRSTLLPAQAVYHGAIAPILANIGKLKPREDKHALDKINDGQFFECFVRILSTSKDVLRAKDNLTTVLASFAPMQGVNRWKPERKVNQPSRYRVPFTNVFLYRRDAADQLHKMMERRDIPVFSQEDYLGPSELASVLHYADSATPFIKRIISKKLPVPEGVDVYPSIEAAWKDKAVVVGASTFRGEIKYVAIKDQKQFSRHLYMIGTTGSGKTTLLQLIAAQVVKLWGWGLIYYDVKGDAVDKLMKFLPDDSDKTLYIDFSNQHGAEGPAGGEESKKKSAKYYIPFNMLRFPEMTDYQLAEMLIGVFVRVFGQSNIMYKSQNYLRDAILAVLATDDKGTILEVYRMFTDEAYLDRTIKELSANGKYPDVLAFWRDVFRQMSPKQRYNETQAIQNKLKMITQNEKPKYTLCQIENMLPWREILDSQKRVLINLAQGSNSDELQRFFGTLLTAFIKRAAWSREDIPEEERKPVLMILDEFEKFAGNAEDIEEMLALARSYGICLLMAHQETKQIKEAGVLEQVLGLTSTHIAFMIGNDSAKRLEGFFPGLDADDLSGLVTGQAAARFKFKSNQTFTFDTRKIEDVLQELTPNIKAAKQKQYARWYRHVDRIDRDINERYTLVERNRPTDKDNSVRKGKARGTLSQKDKERGPFGKIAR